MAESWLPWIGLLIGAVATYLSRAAGVLLSGRIDPDGAIFEWFTCVAYAILAGLVARMVLLPVGSLQEIDLGVRMVSAGLGVAGFLIGGRRIQWGVIAGLSAITLLSSAGVSILT